MPRILVTGATGTHGGVGHDLVVNLINNGVNIRAMVHKEDARAEYLRHIGAETVIGDFQSFLSLQNCLEGIDRAFFCYPLASGLLSATANFCAAAREAKVKQTINLSLMLAAADHPSPVARDHWLSERIFDWSNIGAIHLRGGFFYENILRFVAPWIKSENKLYFPLGTKNVKLAWVNGMDIANSAASILRGADYGKENTLNITDKEPFSINDIAIRIGDLLGKQIEYVPEGIQNFLARISKSIGENKQLEQHIRVLSIAMSSGRVIGVASDAVQNLTLSKPIGLEGFTKRYADHFS